MESIGALPAYAELVKFLPRRGSLKMVRTNTLKHLLKDICYVTELMLSVSNATLNKISFLSLSLCSIASYGIIIYQMEC